MHSCVQIYESSSSYVQRRRDSNPRTGYPIYSLSRGAPWATWVLLYLAPQVGFEPTTYRLTADCSTAELLRNTMVGLNGLEPSTSRLSGVRSNQLSYRPTAHNIWMERVMGIEPTLSAWKAEVLPLNYTRNIRGMKDLNPWSPAWQVCLPLHHGTILVAGTGFEPATFGLWARRATRLLHPATIITYLKWRRVWDLNPRTCYRLRFSRPVY